MKFEKGSTLKGKNLLSSNNLLSFCSIFTPFRIGPFSEGVLF